MTTRIVLFGCALAALLLCAFLLPAREWFLALLHWIELHRATAWLAFILVYVGAAILMFPAIILTMSAGVLFGPLYGSLIVSAGSTLGAAVAFLIGRTVARDWIAHKVQEYPRFKALDRALAKRGFWIVVLTRLTPIFPYNVLNYAYGLTALDFRKYLLASWVGMAGPTVLYVYIGSMARSLTELPGGLGSLGATGPWILGVGLVATLTLIVVVTRVATSALNEELGAC